MDPSDVVQGLTSMLRLGRDISPYVVSDPTSV